MSVLVPVIRAIVLVCWLLSPLILAVSALFPLNERPRPIRSLLIGAVLLVNWALFVAFVITSQTPYGGYYHTSRSTDFLLLLSFLGLIGSAAVSARKWRLSLGNVALITLWIWIAYAPAHWLRREYSVSVTVDGHPVAATVYFGHPNDSEAEAVGLVRLSDGGDYFFDFGSEKVRQATRSDYVRVPGGVWCIRRMQDGVFQPPMPSTHVNELRILSKDKHVVVVQF